LVTIISPVDGRLRYQPYLPVLLLSPYQSTALVLRVLAVVVIETWAVLV